MFHTTGGTRLVAAYSAKPTPVVGQLRTSPPAPAVRPSGGDCWIMDEETANAVLEATVIQLAQTQFEEQGPTAIPASSRVPVKQNEPLVKRPRLTVAWFGKSVMRSEEHTSELQSLRHLVCRL